MLWGGEYQSNRKVLKFSGAEDVEDAVLEDLRWVESNPGDL